MQEQNKAVIINCRHSSVMSNEKVKSGMRALNKNWIANSRRHLKRNFKFQDFINAMESANKVISVSKKFVHHPAFHLLWEKCLVEVWTHKINGLSQNNFMLAKKVIESGKSNFGIKN